MNVRKVRLSVAWDAGGPGIVEIASAIDAVDGVKATNVAVMSSNFKTVKADIVVEGDKLNIEALSSTVERTGAVVHSVGESAFGERIVESTPRRR